MAIGNFIHTWKITKVQKFGSKTIDNSDLSGASTSYTDLICGIWGTLRTTNDHSDHSDSSHCIERQFTWQWQISPIKNMDPAEFVEYADLTESDYVNILKHNGCAGVEEKFEEIFAREFVNEPIDVIEDPFGYNSAT